MKSNSRSVRRLYFLSHFHCNFVIFPSFSSFSLPYSERPAPLDRANIIRLVGVWWARRQFMWRIMRHFFVLKTAQRPSQCPKSSLRYSDFWNIIWKYNGHVSRLWIIFLVHDCWDDLIYSRWLSLSETCYIMSKRDTTTVTAKCPPASAQFSCDTSRYRKHFLKAKKKCYQQKSHFVISILPRFRFDWQSIIVRARHRSCSHIKEREEEKIWVTVDNFEHRISLFSPLLLSSIFFNFTPHPPHSPSCCYIFKASSGDVVRVFEVFRFCHGILKRHTTINFGVNF